MMETKESILDDAQRFLSQAKAIALLLSNENTFDDCEPWVIANTLWMLCDRLADLEGIINKMDIA